MTRKRKFVRTNISNTVISNAIVYPDSGRTAGAIAGTIAFASRCGETNSPVEHNIYGQKAFRLGRAHMTFTDVLCNVAKLKIRIFEFGFYPGFCDITRSFIRNAHGEFNDPRSPVAFVRQKKTMKNTTKIIHCAINDTILPSRRYIVRCATNGIRCIVFGSGRVGLGARHVKIIDLPIERQIIIVSGTHGRSGPISVHRPVATVFRLFYTFPSALP